MKRWISSGLLAAFVMAPFAAAAQAEEGEAEVLVAYAYNMQHRGKWSM